MSCSPPAGPGFRSLSTPLNVEICPGTPRLQRVMLYDIFMVFDGSIEHTRPRTSVIPFERDVVGGVLGTSVGSRFVEYPDSRRPR